MNNNKYKILLVEDESNIRNLVSAMLEASEYRVITATTCKEAETMFSSYMPDLIILDLGLFTLSMAATVSASEPYIILFYLLNIYAFAGVISIMRSFEEKNNGLRSWKRKLFSGIFMILYSVTLVVLSIAFKDYVILKYGYCISLVYAAFVRIMTAFKKTAVVYIQ